jgi:catechol 2,3-dioxygenase-like lactoylglutathione lyase family enzyme
MSNGTTDFWIIQTEEKYKNLKYYRKGTGINHISFKVNSKDDVNKFVDEFLVKNKIKTLYKTPRIFPEYNKEYYAVFFEDPDRIKLEVTYTPKHQ